MTDFTTSEKVIVENQIKVWLEKGIISPSCSEYESTILLMKRQDSTMLCIDYRRLNKKMVKYRFPFANIEEQIDRLYNFRNVGFRKWIFP